ncbi:MAG: cyclic nucleotide-binding domain-containing protein [Actinomycetota bacterium]
MTGRTDTLREVVRDRRAFRAVTAYGLFAMAEQGAWITILVYAYAAGGAAAAGLAAVAQEIPAAVAAPFLALLGDRKRHIALPLSYALEALALGVTALALFLDAPIPVVIGCAAIATSALAMARPAHAAVLPAIVRTPEALTAANVGSGLLANIGNFSGPAVAGICLSLAGADVAFVVVESAVAIGAFLSLGLVERDDGDARGAGDASATVWRDTRAGIALLLGEPTPRALALTVAACSVIVGALEVLLVAAAVELVGLGESGGGLLNALLGLGGVAGAAFSVSLIGRRRLAPAIAGGNLALGAALGAAAGVPTTLTVPAFVFFAGAGNAYTAVAAQTLLQRAIPDRLRSRGFGALEGVLTLALAAGAILASTLLATVGPRAALALAGALPVVALLIGFARLVETDRAVEAPDPLRVALLRRIPMFAPLPPLGLEGVARSLVPTEVPAGGEVIRQGDVGDRFYILAAGRLSIRKEGVEVATCDPGGYVGEIALLRDVPRTATVIALEDSLLLALDRAPFLEAVTGHPQSRAVAEDVADARIRNDPTPPGPQASA